MRTVARLLPILFSLLLTFAPLSASACDLSCWLERNAPDCHSLGSAAENAHGAMSGASDMDMSSGADTRLANAHDIAASDHAVNAVVHHSMPTQMNMRRGSLQAMQKSDASSSARFDDSNTLSPCVHGTCAQSATSSSPPSAGHAQLAHLQFVAFHALNLAKPWTTSTRAAPETSPPVSVLFDLLPTLRI
jgi:hypothetical protein